jgi:hypothetical protein
VLTFISDAQADIYEATDPTYPASSIYLHGDLESQVGFDILAVHREGDVEAALGDRDSAVIEAIVEHLDGARLPAVAYLWVPSDLPIISGTLIGPGGTRPFTARNIKGFVVAPGDQDARGAAAARLALRPAMI